MSYIPVRKNNLKTFYKAKGFNIMKDRLMLGEQLKRGERITSINGNYTLIMQDDGNLVHKAMWESGDDVH